MLLLQQTTGHGQEQGPPVGSSMPGAYIRATLTFSMANAYYCYSKQLQHYPIARPTCEVKHACGSRQSQRDRQHTVEPAQQWALSRS